MPRRVTGIRSVTEIRKRSLLAVALAGSSVLAVAALTGFGIAGMGPLAALAGPSDSGSTTAPLRAR